MLFRLDANTRYTRNLRVYVCLCVCMCIVEEASKVKERFDLMRSLRSSGFRLTNCIQQGLSVESLMTRTGVEVEVGDDEDKRMKKTGEGVKRPELMIYNNKLKQDLRRDET